MMKLVVDVKREILAVDGELHADLEDFLIQSGSKQEDVWGANIYPHKGKENLDFIEFTALIKFGHRSEQNHGNHRSLDSRANFCHCPSSFGVMWMYPLVHHRHLEPVKWYSFSKVQQLLMIASELARAGKWMERNDVFAVQQCDERAFELIDLTLEDPKWSGKTWELLAERYQAQSMDFQYNRLLYRILLQMHPESEKILTDEEKKIEFHK